MKNDHKIIVNGGDVSNAAGWSLIPDGSSGEKPLKISPFSHLEGKWIVENRRNLTS